MYCGTIAYELEHLSDHQQRVWLRQAIESRRYRAPLERRREEGALQAPLRGRGHGALPPQAVPRPEAVLARRPRRDDPDARRDDRAGRGIRRPRRRAGHGAPRPAERARAHDRDAVRVHPPRVRGRADDRRRHRRPRRRDRRRQVPPRRARHAHDGEREGRCAPGREPEPPRSGRSRRRRSHPRRADRPLDPKRRARSVRRAAGAAARRCRLRRPGDRRRDPQPARARGLLDRRHACT